MYGIALNACYKGITAKYRHTLSLIVVLIGSIYAENGFSNVF